MDTPVNESYSELMRARRLYQRNDNNFTTIATVTKIRGEPNEKKSILSLHLQALITKSNGAFEYFAS